ncbi:MAG: abortive infection system antitoxin AbiGi family protein [Bacteroidota bacterium]|nr:abortive infection system antitoxin AbiGi family protein [Bacteroidota bacterium]
MISANTLFHFTKKQYLLNILEGCAFNPRYCFEDIATKDISLNTEPDLGVPMVCFCDIPLSQIKEHINTYGSYGIGLTKKWGMANGLSPLQYTYYNSITAKTFQEKRGLIDSLQKSITLKEMYILRDLYLYTHLFLKPYEGRIFRNGVYSPEIIKFYDEKEWRYIPDIRSFLPLNLHAVVDYKDFAKDPKIFDNAHDLLAKNCSLKFQIKDISYLILESENEIEFFLNKIDELFVGKFDMNDINKLKTRIITKTQINNDL